MEEDFQEFLDAFHPQPLEFFKKTEVCRRENPLSSKDMTEIMNQHRSKSFSEYFPKDVFSKNCSSDAAVTRKEAFGDNAAVWEKSSLPGCQNCYDSVLHLDHDQPCWFLKREITLHMFAWVSLLRGYFNIVPLLVLKLLGLYKKAIYDLYDQYIDLSRYRAYKIGFSMNESTT